MILVRFGRSVTALITGVVIALTVLTVTGCGDSAGSRVVANVGGSIITRADVNHWMSTIMSQEYYGLATKPSAPPAIVGDPPNYPVCISRLEDAAARSPIKVVVSTSHLLVKCRELFQALKLEAVGFLVKVAWTAGVTQDLGITASASEVRVVANRQDTDFREDDPVHNLLRTHQLSYSDELLEAKPGVLSSKLLTKLKAGGSQTAAKLAALERRWTAKTNCQPGYVVEHCRQYASQPATTGLPSAVVLLEQVAALVTGQCIDRPACSRQ